MIEIQESSGEQHSYVVAGAILSCTWGTKRTRLTTTDKNNPLSS